MKGKDVNDKLSTISRVVVHPKFPTIGLGVKLVRKTLAKARTPYVETVAVMARYNPFFERAGLTKIAEKKPNKDLVQLHLMFLTCSTERFNEVLGRIFSFG
ncbi:MAG: hypothetical protein AOA66_1146 [Candidatus Bathyarchaeota archaeon BA2]|nr:MAG: hypothetical protein AOA66_1146 [Candidatus Bathyarchaeota archaeon BA2]